MISRWVDEPPLPKLVDPKPPPPARLIRVHGAQLVRVYNIDDPDPRKWEGFTEVLFLAWAPIRGGEDWVWAVLTAWLGHRQTGSRTTGGGRHAWLLLTRDDLRRGRGRPAEPMSKDEAEWWGHDSTAQFSIAVRAAAATLPKGLRERALRQRLAAPSEPQASRAPRQGPTRSDAQ